MNYSMDLKTKGNEFDENKLGHRSVHIEQGCESYEDDDDYDVEQDKNNLKGEEVDKATRLISLLVTNCSWTENFHPFPAQIFQLLTKYQNTILSYRLFC